MEGSELVFTTNAPPNTFSVINYVNPVDAGYALGIILHIFSSTVHLR